MKHFNPLSLAVALFSLTLLAACSDGNDSTPPEQQSTSMSIDTEEGSFSYKESGDGENTSVNIDTDEGDSK